ncbi:MAG: peptide deformylase [Clostridia bacterium]|nr:peptide deformylase [Clostridia bacterium]
MAIMTIVKDTDEILRKKCRPVTDITPRIIQLLDDMADTLHDSGGVGLAAPQVGVLRRICIIEVEPGELIEFINPVITEKKGSQQEIEGCLSAPGKWGYTKRPAKVTVKALDRNGEEFSLEAEELLARAVCHETDHLEGVLFYDNAVRMLSREEIAEMEADD